jgi:hypothetical protein
MTRFSNHEPTLLQKERMKLETRYLAFSISIFHAVYVLSLVSNGLPPRISDFGSVLVYMVLLLINIHLYDESKCYYYCYWHRHPILFSIYYEITRILFSLGIIKWNVTTWNSIDAIAMTAIYVTWIIGYIAHNHLAIKIK